MPKIIEVPGQGRVEFPDDMDDAAIVAAIKRTTAPAPRNVTDDMSTTERVLAGAGKAFYDIGRGVGQMTGLVSQKEIDEARSVDANLMNTGAGTAGNVLGNVAIALPAMAIPGANSVAGSAVIGSALGAMAPTATGESRAANAGLGAAGGAAGAAAAKALGRLVRPVQTQLSPEMAGLAAKAEAAGIKLDAADKTGSRPLKVMRSVMESMPLTADKQRQIAALKKMAFNKAVLANIGENADTVTPELLGAAKGRIGGEFNRLTQNAQIPLGDDFVNTLAGIESKITPFSSPGIKGAVDKGMDLAAKGPLDGRTYQNVRQVLGKQSSDAFRSGSSEMGQALKTLRSGLDDEAGKAIPAADQAAWETARKQYKNLKVIEKTARPTSVDAVEGNISPAKFAQALSQMDPNGATYGTDGMSELARIGKSFVQESIPNSGTAERTLMQNLLTNPLDAVWQGSLGSLGVPVQAAMNSKAGQKYLTDGLIKNTPQNKLIADYLRRMSVGAGANAAVLGDQ